jgi:hypothetical protein
METVMETTALENAAIMLEVTKGVYERYGLKEEVKKLRGLEVTTPNSIMASLMILQSLPSDISELVVTKQQAETALKEAGIVLRAVLDS